MNKDITTSIAQSEESTLVQKRQTFSFEDALRNSKHNGDELTQLMQRLLLEKDAASE